MADAAAVDAAVASGGDPGPLAGVPVAVKDLIDQAGIPNTAGSGIPTFGPEDRRHRGGPAPIRRGRGGGTDRAPRVRLRILLGERVVRAGAQPVGPVHLTRGFLGRVGRRRRRRAGPGGTGNRHRRVGAGSGGVVRGGRAQGHARGHPDHRGVPAGASLDTVGPDHPQRRRRRLAVRRARRARPERPLVPGIGAATADGRRSGSTGSRSASPTRGWTGPSPTRWRLRVGCVPRRGRGGGDRRRRPRPPRPGVSRRDARLPQPPGRRRPSPTGTTPSRTATERRSARVASALDYTFDDYLDGLAWRRRVADALDDALDRCTRVITPAVAAMRKTIGVDTITVGGPRRATARCSAASPPWSTTPGIPPWSPPSPRPATRRPAMQLIGRRRHDHALLDLGMALEDAGLVPRRRHRRSGLSDRRRPRRHRAELRAADGGMTARCHGADIE